MPVIFEQTRENTCALASLRTALALCGKSASEEELVKILEEGGIPLRKWGICTPALGFLARKLGLSVTLHIRKEILGEYAQDKDYGKALQALEKVGGKISATERGPNLPLLLSLLKSSVPIVHLYGFDYYGLPRSEDWGHYLVLAPNEKQKAGFEVLDCYRKRGARMFKGWGAHLKKADRFDWSKWSDEIIEIRKV